VFDFVGASGNYAWPNSAVALSQAKVVDPARIVSPRQISAPDDVNVVVFLLWMLGSACVPRRSCNLVGIFGQAAEIVYRSWMVVVRDLGHCE